MAIAMTEKTSSYEKVVALFTPDSLWTTRALATKTKLSRVTISNVLKVLELGKQIEKVGYKQREGYLYAPVARGEFLIRLGSEFYTLEGFLTSIQSLESPTSAIPEDKWNRIKLLILQVIFKDNTNLGDKIKDYLDDFEAGALEFYRLISSLNSPDLWSSERRAELSTLISSSPVAMNTYADLKERWMN